MPIYSYRCPNGCVYEKLAKYDDVNMVCTCGEVATRRDFYMPTVIAHPAAPPYGGGDWVKQEKKKLKAKGWDYDRAIGEIGQATVVDDQGNSHLDTTRIPE